ncbi:MAG: RNA polymerase sigma-I factor [Clostridia bacterium]|nr:RNA polymerase sigma-I factor [Clostridia bacterium]
MLSFARLEKSNTGQSVKKVEDLVLSIQKGNLPLREQLIMEYKPFILNCVAKYTQNYQGIDSDEFSIALIAFNEAINAFKIVRGMSFLGFSELVIKNRLADNARRNKSQRNVIPFTCLEPEAADESARPYEVGSEDPSFQRLEFAEEIKAYSMKLLEYGIKFKELIRLSPKHKDTRRRLVSLAQTLYHNKPLLFKLKKSKQIPIQELLDLSSVCRGTIEQNRKYIIALVLILDSHLETLKGYIDVSYEGGVVHDD